MTPTPGRRAIPRYPRPATRRCPTVIRLTSWGTAYVMTAVLVIMVLLALVFGIGALLEGVLWVLFIAVALFGIAAWFGWRQVREWTWVGARRAPHERPA